MKVIVKKQYQRPLNDVLEIISYKLIATSTLENGGQPQENGEYGEARDAFSDDNSENAETQQVDDIWSNGLGSRGV